MTKRFKVWCDSGANIYSCREQFVTLDEIGHTEAEWSAMSEEAREEVMRDIAFDRLDWGFCDADA